MKRTISILFLIISLNVQAQQTDILGNIYSINKFVLQKKDSIENKIFCYENFNLGEISSVDISNSFHLLVFYKDFNTCIILDNKLSEIKQINFNKYNIKANVICMSEDNNIWVYDNFTENIIKLNANSEKIICKKYFLFNNPPLFLCEQDNHLIFITNNETLVFNDLCEVIRRFSLNYKCHLIFKNELIITNKKGEKIKFSDGKIVN